MFRQDKQRQLVYDAEWSLEIFHKFPVPEISDIDYEVNRLVQSRWWKNRWPDVEYVNVKSCWGKRGWANRDKRWIKMPPFVRRRMYMLHELAHIITPTNLAPHGPLYCAHYLILVEKVMGPDAAKQLRAAFDAYGVQYYYPKSVTFALLNN